MRGDTDEVAGTCAEMCCENEGEVESTGGMNPPEDLSWSNELVPGICCRSSPEWHYSRTKIFQNEDQGR